MIDVSNLKVTLLSARAGGKMARLKQKMARLAVDWKKIEMSHRRRVWLGYYRPVRPILASFDGWCDG